MSQPGGISRGAPAPPPRPSPKKVVVGPSSTPGSHPGLTKALSTNSDYNSSRMRTVPTIDARSGLGQQSGPPSPTKSPRTYQHTTARTFDYAAVRAQFEQMQSASSAAVSPQRPPSRKYTPQQVQVPKMSAKNSASQVQSVSIPRPGPGAAKSSPRIASLHPSTPREDALPATELIRAPPQSNPPRPPVKKAPGKLPPRPASLANPKAGSPKKGHFAVAQPAPGPVKKAPSRPLPVPTPPSVSSVPATDLFRSQPSTVVVDVSNGEIGNHVINQLDLAPTTPSQPAVSVDPPPNIASSPPISPRPMATVSRVRRPAVSHQPSLTDTQPSSAAEPSNAPPTPIAGQDSMSQVDAAPKPASPAGRKRAIAIRPSSKFVVASPVLERKMSQADASPSTARRFVVKEIVETEEVFVQDVLRTISGFVMPMRNMPKLISAVEMGKLFANIEMIMITSSEMAKELRAAVSAVSTPEESQIGVVFSKNATTLESAFAQYCRANSEALQLLSKLQKKSSFASALETLEAAPEVVSGGGLLSFLVKPVQRVCKYPLLLRELQRNTPLDHADHTAVGSALEIIGRLVDKVNMTARETENISNLLRVESQLSDAPSSLKLIMPGRRYLREGRWMKISGRNTQERQVYLFNDMLIYAKPAVLAKNKFVFKGIIPLHEARFEPHGDGVGQPGNSIRITRMDNNKTYVLFDESEEENRDDWLSDIETSRKESSEKPAGSAVVGAFHMAETSPDARKDAITMLAIETKISGWSNASPQRRFLASGPLKYVLAGASDSSSDIEHRGFLFLFTDSAVLAKQIKSAQSRVPFQFRESFDFAACVAQDLDQVDLDGDKAVYHAILLSSATKQKRVVLLFVSAEEKTKWLDLMSSPIVGSPSSEAADEQSPDSDSGISNLTHVSSDARASTSLPRTASVPPSPNLRSPSVTRAPSFSGMRLPAGVSSRGSFADAAGPTLKTKKSFFGKKLGYITTEDRRGSGLASPRTDGDAEEAREEPDEPDRRESVEGFEIPPWDPDDSSDSCTNCSTRFSATNRKHHCRNCGKLFDAKCTTKKCMLPRYGFTKKKVRVCDKCFANH